MILADYAHVHVQYRRIYLISTGIIRRSFKKLVLKRTHKALIVPAPNRQRTLNKLSTELQCRDFVNKHRLSIQIGT